METKSFLKKSMVKEQGLSHTETYYSLDASCVTRKDVCHVTLHPRVSLSLYCIVGLLVSFATCPYAQECYGQLLLK